MSIPRLSVLLLFSATRLPTAAGDPVPDFHFRHSVLSIVSENDKYFAGTDRTTPTVSSSPGSARPT